jgi:hypothetical protein
VQLADIRPRGKRLERLSMGLAKDLSIIDAGEDPHWYRERKPYLEGFRQALAGVEGARVILARAAQRLEGNSTRNKE